MRRVEMLASGPVTRQASGRLVVETRGQGFTEITAEVAGFVREAGLRHGLLTVFCRHTSASLTIQENADPDVRTDLMTALDRLAPRDVPYVHGIEGPDDMPAHIRTLLTDAALAIPLVEGRLALGTWQGIYLIEHRDRPHRREIVLHLAGA
ncbi:secondary thiamine-phosphate synthase enzyme YjbQ [uncultured Methylobacterium sp.]|uniref:secondary thiamine-phosphate synthase enzyme YjbQ n=1 Tax=uncultured Methylobacterium sp. TaxID=157278 RepID=UPI002595DB56|nr:secondary thiamine-phosphate synthase enzyme YjbQ [uncultured Methylobacterium sp.]